MHVLVEIHHLEAVELVRDFFDLLLLARLNDFYALSIPVDVFARRRLVLTTSFDSAAGNLSIMDIRDLMM